MNMKRIYITLVLLSMALQADCSKMPLGMELAKKIEAHEVAKAKKLLVQYKEDVKNYLAACDQSKEKFEETSIMIHSYEAKLEDLEYDMNKADHGTDCSVVPSSVALEKAFKTPDAVKIKALYTKYKTASHNYIEHCTSHEEYETVYEASMMCDEEYEAWSKK